MPNRCSAYGCTNNSNKTFCRANRISFHRFPLKDEKRLKTWITRIKRENFKATVHSFLCSEHFTEEDFEYELFTNRRLLKRSAVPSRFSFMGTTPEHQKTSHDFGFPKDEIVRNEWIAAVRKLIFQPSKNSRLCSEPSTGDQIDHTSLSCVRFRENAVPKIFETRPEYRKKLKQLRKGMKRKFTSEEDEKSLSDEGLEETRTIPSSSDNGLIESSDLSSKEEVNAYQSSNGENKNGYSHHPNILRIIPADKVENTSASNLLSSHSLDPELTDASSTCHQVGNSLMTEKNNSTTIPVIVVRSCSLPAAAESSVETDLRKKLRHHEMMNKNYRKQIKILQQKDRRQQAKIESLKRQVKALESIQSSDEDVSEDCISENEIYEELLKHQRENIDDSDS